MFNLTRLAYKQSTRSVPSLQDLAAFRLMWALWSVRKGRPMLPEARKAIERYMRSVKNNEVNLSKIKTVFAKALSLGGLFPDLKLNTSLLPKLCQPSYIQKCIASGRNYDYDLDDLDDYTVSLSLAFVYEPTWGDYENLFENVDMIKKLKYGIPSSYGRIIAKMSVKVQLVEEWNGYVNILKIKSKFTGWPTKRDILAWRKVLLLVIGLKALIMDREGRHFYDRYVNPTTAVVSLNNFYRKTISFHKKNRCSSNTSSGRQRSRKSKMSTNSRKSLIRVLDEIIEWVLPICYANIRMAPKVLD